MGEEGIREEEEEEENGGKEWKRGERRENINREAERKRERRDVCIRISSGPALV